MSRPMAVAGFAYLTGLMFAAFALPLWGFAIALTVSLVLLILSALWSVKRRAFTPILLAGLCVFVSLIQYSLVYNAKIAPSLKYEGAKGKVTALITETKIAPTYSRYSCKLESFDGQAEAENVEFTLWDYDTGIFDSGDRISAEVEFEALDTVYGPEGFNSYLSHGILLEAEAKEGSVTVIERMDRKVPLSEKLRNFFSVRMKSFMPLSGSDLACAMLFGERDGVIGSTYDNFRLSGTAHMLAISGFHLTVLMGFVGVFCDFIGLGRKSRSLITAAFILIYMFVTGLPYSVVRAGIMALVMCLSQLSGRERDNLSALSLAVFLICTLSPLSVWDLGFLLSVSSMLGIVLLHEKLNSFCSIHIYNSTLPAALRFTLKAVIPPISVGLCASVGAFPLVAVTFRYYNLLSVITSTLLSIPATVLLVGALAIAIFGDLGISRLIGMAVSVSAQIIKSVTAFFAETGGISLPFTLGILALYFVILVAVFALSRRYAGIKKIIAAALCCVIVFTAVSVADTIGIRKLEGIYVSVSASAESVLFVKDGKAYCISTGSTLPYAPRQFAADMGLEIVGNNKEDKDPGTVYPILEEGEFLETRAGISARALGLDVLINDDMRVDGDWDILIQSADKIDMPLKANVAELTVLCLNKPRDKTELSGFMPAGRNIILEAGCGIFIEFSDGLTVTKYDYGY